PGAPAAPWRRREPGRARRQGLHPDAGDPAAGTRPAARRHHLARAGGGRGPDPGRRHARSAGEVVGRPGSRTGMMDEVSDQPDAAPDAALATANRVRLLAAIAVAVLVA